MGLNVYFLIIEIFFQLFFVYVTLTNIEVTVSHKSDVQGFNSMFIISLWF